MFVIRCSSVTNMFPILLLYQSDHMAFGITGESKNVLARFKRSLENLLPAILNSLHNLLYIVYLNIESLVRRKNSLPRENPTVYPLWIFALKGMKSTVVNTGRPFEYFFIEFRKRFTIYSIDFPINYRHFLTNLKPFNDLRSLFNPLLI